MKRFMRSPSGQALRYRIALVLEEREGFTFTQFLRLPSQFEALTGPVLDFLGAQRVDEPLRIVVVGCSSGAEPYSISSVLLHHRPQLAVTIDAYDIDTDMISVARSATYSASAVLDNALVTPEFVARTFDPSGEFFVVKRHVADRVRFHHADVLDPAHASRIAPADIVFAQNVMCNLQRPMARRLFDTVVSLMKPRSALFVDGMDLDMRASRSRAHGLEPLSYALERIHEEARVVRGPRYPRYATGLEPFSHRRAEAERAYATIFLRDSGRNTYPSEPSSPRR